MFFSFIILSTIAFLLTAAGITLILEGVIKYFKEKRSQ